jgi:hypothetical protein
MIWTGDAGRVEIEITRPGPIYIADDSADVRSADGRRTRRKRFFENAVLVMVPEHYREGRVVDTLGTVMVARDRDAVLRFVERYGVLAGTVGPSTALDLPAELRVRRLSKPRLE